MLKNYIKIAFRNMKRYKGFSFINIFGLAIGLSCSFLVFTYVFDELSYDRFHQDADRIYRIISDFKSKDSADRGLLTSYILAKTLRENYPEKFQVTQIKLKGSIVTINSKSFGNERIIGADNSFFNMFTYQFVIGNPKTALNSPHEAIITNEAAIKYFGNSEAIGQTIQVDGNTYKITGIVKTNHQNSHFNFDVVFSLKSLSNYGDTRFLYNYYSTYVKLPLSVPVSRLKNILAEYSENNIAPLLANTDISISLSCEPLLDIHLHSDLNGPYGANSKIEYVYIFSVIAFLILVIACINYINLTTAKNLNRAREVGIRKVLGSLTGQINKQFLLESVVFCWIAMGIAQDEKGDYKILTDLQDLEDAKGGMDFKVAGTKDGITAIQMDTKSDGLTSQMVKDTLSQAKKARLEILDKMSRIIKEPRKELSPYAPRIYTLRVNPDKIRDLIGPADVKKGIQMFRIPRCNVNEVNLVRLDCLFQLALRLIREGYMLNRTLFECLVSRLLEQVRKSIPGLQRSGILRSIHNSDVHLRFEVTFKVSIKGQDFHDQRDLKLHGHGHLFRTPPGQGQPDQQQ